LLSAHIGNRYVFLHGFAKDETSALRFIGKACLDLSGDSLATALQSGVLMEVHREQDH
jgi:hypothetical protein